MSERTVSVAEAKARLSELIAAAEAGDDVIITKRGTPVAQLTAARSAGKTVDLAWLRQMTDGMPMQTEDSVTVVRRMRDGDRY